MKYIGVHLGHDASITALDANGELIFHAHAERFGMRSKKQENTIQMVLDAFPSFTFGEGDVISLVYHFPMQTEVIKNEDERLVRRSKQTIRIGRKKEVICNYIVNHHIAHAVSSWCFRRNSNKKLFLSYDGSGPDFDNYQRSSMLGWIDDDQIAIEEVDCIPSSLHLHNVLGMNSAGKAMGLAGYLPDVPPLSWSPNEVLTILDSFLNRKNKCVPKYATFGDDPKSHAFVAGFYKFMINQIDEKIDQILNRYQPQGVVLGGGTALALEINSNIYRKVQDVSCGPAVDDSGLSIGAAAFAYFMHHKKWIKLQSPSLVHLQEPLDPIGPQDAKDVAKLITSGTSVGLLRGKAEAGPRALGFRSILADARDKNNLHKVSVELKGRELYRPLAPIVTARDFDKLFIGPKGDYMQYRVFCTELCQKELPAIVHVDLTARPQVISPEDKWLHELLTEVGKETGFECLINTSLNGPGKPICNTFTDAKNDFKGRDIKLISIQSPASKYSLGEKVLKQPHYYL